jgi:hypothetical protein
MKTADEMQALIDQNLALALELKQTYEPTPPPDGTIINVSDAPDGARSYQVVPPYHPNICGR